MVDVLTAVAVGLRNAYSGDECHVLFALPGESTVNTRSVAFLLLLLTAMNIQASDVPTEHQLVNWHQWRGPFANGTAADGAAPPIEWSNSDNIGWTADLPGEGTSTPIVWGNQVFVLSAKQTDREAEAPPSLDERSKTVPPDVYYRFFVTSVDRRTGEVLWQKLAAEQVPHEGHHPTHTYAGGSPTTDGRTALCFIRVARDLLLRARWTAALESGPWKYANPLRVGRSGYAGDSS